MSTPGSPPSDRPATPPCCAEAAAADARALHPVDPLLARIGRTMGAPVLHPTDTGLAWVPCSLDCAASIAAGGALLTDPLQVAVPAEAPLYRRDLDPATASGQRPVSVVVLDFQRGETDFMGSVELQFAAADLARTGHRAELRRVYTDITGRRFDPGARASLAAALIDEGVELVLIRTHVWPDFVAALRAGGVGTVFVAQPGWRDARADAEHYDVAISGGDRQGIVALVDGFARTGELVVADRTLEPFPTDFLQSAWFWPAVRYRDAVSGEVRPFRRLMLLHNVGCPWSADVGDNPVYDGLALGDSVKRKGCVYCAIGGDYRKLPVDDYLGFLSRQIGWYAEACPEAEIVLSDEASFSFFGDLVDRLAADGVRPGPLLIKARMNGLLAILPRFERMLERAREAGLRIVVYLLGIESFSDRALQLYNKGITAERLAEGLNRLLELEERFGETFSATRYNSHGFILFNPWTTLEELAENLVWFERLRIGRFSGKAVWSRLRLYPWQPLYALAERDGLLDQSDRFAAVVHRQVGYHGDERGWRFADPQVELCYALVTRGRDAHPNQDAVGVEIFRRALERARATPLDGPLPVAELERAFEQMRAEAPVFFAGQGALRATRRRVQDAVGLLARKSERLRWRLAAFEAEDAVYRVRFERGEEGLEAALDPESGRLRWDAPGSRSAALFAKALDLALER